MTAYDINEKLFLIYGRDADTDKPKYRVVRSEIQTEKRNGAYELLTQSGIWLGQRCGIAEIKKYWYMSPCWLLERVEANTNRSDLINEKFTYEPLLPFLDKDDKPLELAWKPIEFMLNRLEKAAKQFKTEQDHKEEEEKKQREEEKRVFGILDAPDPTKELPTFKNSTLLNKSTKFNKVNNYAKSDSGIYLPV